MSTPVQTLPAVVHFTRGRDYEITWQIQGVHREPRQSRLGFFNALKGNLIFDARGPERSTEFPFGGTWTMDPKWIIEVREVTRDLSKRYAIRR